MATHLRAGRASAGLASLLMDRARQGMLSEACWSLGSSTSWRTVSSSSGQQPADGPDIDFGFKQVPRDAKQSLVGQVFSSVASSYDVMNDLMSGGMHRLWKDRLVEALRPFPGQEHLDVAGGTGDVAFRVLRAVRAAEVEERMAAARAGRTSAGGRPRPPADAAGPGPGSAAAAGATPRAEGAAGASRPGAAAASPLVPGRVVVCDINPDMLREGKQKAAATSDLAGDAGLSFVEGNAEQLPFDDTSFDSYTIAFGIRNVTDRPAALREALRVLKPGGRFLCLEFSQVTQPGLRELYDAYSFAVIPRIGHIVANDAASYQYLVESIRKFPDQEAFARLIEDAGFRAVTYENMSGGIVALHSGFKL
ncbi:hypothetical protein HYH03_005970 [Edaphochlamys debaryana]|uniref:2-methoxy-6-polyprenyl-1,4-benzoquinol methylase, mitochondrial n=1 Tax=Edaphochlamys debaryana TaxID=47281 RepID=A0A835Y4W9_9CHLO|nr:hypothetical protein HYH03_005970 [Edaphochlamys debaryana]|eukprot:KAG2496051.1 hypothetical protein HYH03_005970 [Edaphochlamys debaryana]